MNGASEIMELSRYLEGTRAVSMILILSIDEQTIKADRMDQEVY